jgi:hypothetical protein
MPPPLQDMMPPPLQDMMPPPLQGHDGGTLCERLRGVHALD